MGLPRSPGNVIGGTEAIKEAIAPTAIPAEKLGMLRNLFQGKLPGGMMGLLALLSATGAGAYFAGSQRVPGAAPGAAPVPPKPQTPDEIRAEKNRAYIEMMLQLSAGQERPRFTHPGAQFMPGYREPATRFGGY